MNTECTIKQDSAVYPNRISVYSIKKQNMNLNRNKEWDICYKYDYPNNVLCNFSPSPFVLDNTAINSMEGFLQSLKVQDPQIQEKICQLPGFLAKKMGNYLRKSSKYDGEHLYWKNQPINRYSKQYQELLRKAYKAKYTYDRNFRKILDSSKGYTLTHKTGKTSPQETVLTEQEFIYHLNILRQSENIPNAVHIMISSMKSLFDNNKQTPVISQNLPNLKTTFINSHLICGEDICAEKKCSIKKLKQVGVKNLIQINASSEQQECNRKLCQDNGLNYFCLDINSKNWRKLANEDLITLINIMNEKEVSYICCGTRQDSNPVLILNYLFNPNASIPDAIVFGTPKKRTVQNLVSAIMKNISQETANKLHWNNEFRNSLSERKKILHEINE